MESKLMEILSDWNFWGSFKRDLIPRERYERILKAFLEGREVVTITGIRRAGKSSLIYRYLNGLLEQGVLKAENTLVINFEDPRLPEMDVKSLTEIFEVYMRNLNPSGKIIVVLDEVQYVEGWEKFARWLIDTRDTKVIATGSSSKLMSEDYATALAGRHLDIEVGPLTFKEFLKFKGLFLKDSIDLARDRYVLQNLLREYLEFGGFPEVVLSSDEARKMELLRNYFNDILVKDAARRYRVEKLDKFERLARLYISNTSTVQSFNRIARVLKVSLDTVERYSRYLESARLIKFLDKFSFSVAEQTRSMKKVYAADTGFYTSLGFKFMENLWRTMENVVAVNLIAYGYEIYYLKGLGYDVDFVVKSLRGVERLVQVTYASHREEIRDREVRSLVKASRELRCRNAEVVTWTYEGTENADVKVNFIPLWKWLLRGS